MSLFTMPTAWQQLSPFHDDRVAYEIAMNECEKQARIVAFAAIRRAAAVAREMDRRADAVRYDISFAYIDMAKGARAAIRAAIGSEKAS